jgi:hypothetical protein
MVSWLGDGGINGIQTGSFFPSDTAYILAGPGGMVDVNGGLRLQYNLHKDLFIDEAIYDSIGLDDRITARANIRYVNADFTAYPGRRMTLTMFVADAALFPEGDVPTPFQVLAQGNNLQVYRANKSYAEPSDRSFTLRGPRAGQLNPGTKYWVLVLPTSITDMSTTPSTVNDISIGSPNIHGRGLSLWTNRQPLAPVITSPLSGTVAPAGSLLTLSFLPNDPDLLFGGTIAILHEDRSGVQLQYAPRPSAENPSPTWIDLPINGDTIADARTSWFLQSNANPATYNPGANDLSANKTIGLACGINTFEPLAADLPSGAWQIRLRTFDFGHPYPLFIPPFAKYPSEVLSPAIAPAANTSPWSEPLYITVTARVPPPIPLSPLNNIALPEGSPVTLSWQYRNTFIPPFPQKSRVVEIRNVTDPTWTTLVSEDSDETSLIVSGFPLVAGNEYQWRVKVTDDADGAGDEESNYSALANFWMVSAPASGDVRPVPSSTIEGATLGCGTHRVLIFRRGGTRHVGEITGLTEVRWGRLRDDISDARITVAGWDLDCGNLLAKLQTWAYEVVILRDNGYSVDRVWEGPITLLTYKTDEVVIQARDVMVYAYRRIVRQAMNDSQAGGVTVVQRAAQVLQNAFAPDDPNVLAYLQVLAQDDDAKQYRNLPAFSRTAYEEVDDMAANAGLDYTAVGRAILLWGTRHRIGTLPEFTDNDLGSEPIVSEYGMSFANFYSVSDGNGVHGDASRLDVSGNDETYGIVEMLSSSWASDSEVDTGTYTQAGLATIVESFEGYAERSIADRYPPPVVVRVPDNTTLNPDAVISIQQLVPGVLIPLRSTGTLRKLAATQKLDSVTVTETSGSETITLVMSPFSRDDSSEDGSGESD